MPFDSFAEKLIRLHLANEQYDQLCQWRGLPLIQFQKSFVSFF